MAAATAEISGDYEPINLNMDDGTFVDLGWELVSGSPTVSLSVDTGEALAANQTPAEANRLADAAAATRQARRPSW